MGPGFRRGDRRLIEPSQLDIEPAGGAEDVPLHRLAGRGGIAPGDLLIDLLVLLAGLERAAGRVVAGAGGDDGLAYLIGDEAEEGFDMSVGHRRGTGRRD